MSIPEAIDTFRQAFSEDTGLEYSYQSNIAMAFFDAYAQYFPDRMPDDTAAIHKIANVAACAFLDKWLEEQ